MVLLKKVSFCNLTCNTPRLFSAYQQKKIVLAVTSFIFLYLFCIVQLNSQSIKVFNLKKKYLTFSVLLPTIEDYLNMNEIPFFKLEGKYFLGSITGETVGGITPFCITLNESDVELGIDSNQFCNYIKNGKFLNSIPYKKTESFSSGLGLVIDPNNLAGFVDEYGNYAIPPTYSEAESFSEDLSLVEKSLKKFFIDKKDKIIFEQSKSFSEMYSFQEGLALFRVRDNFGYLDKTGKIVLKPIFRPDQRYAMELNPKNLFFKNGYAIIEKPYDEKNPDKIFISFIDKKGKTVLDLEDTASDYIRLKDKIIILNQNSCKAYRRNKISFEVSKCTTEEKTKNSTWSDEQYKTNNLTEVTIEKKDTNTLFLKDKGKLAITLKNKQDTILFTIPNKKIFINQLGEPYIWDKYEEIGLLKEDRIYIKRDGKYGFIDSSFKEVIPCKFEEVTHFSGGIAGFKLNSKWGILNNTGKILVPPTYESIKYPSEGMMGVQKNNQWGLVDKTGRLVIPYKFDTMGIPSKGFVAMGIEREEFYFQYYNYNGKLLSKSKFLNNNPFLGGKMKNTIIYSDNPRHCSFDTKGNESFCIYDVNVNMP